MAHDPGLKENSILAKKGFSISVKLIAISILQMILVVSLFGVLNIMQSRRIIDDSAKRLADKIADGLREAGTAQLNLLADSTLIAIVQGDYTPLQSILYKMRDNDKRITEVAVVDNKGMVLAHSEPELVGTRAKGFISETLPANTMWVKSGVMARKKKSITFALPVENNRGRLCSVFLAYSLDPLEAELKKADQLKELEVKKTFNRTIIVGVLSVLVGILLAIFQGLRISRPIQALARQADQIADGDLYARVSINSKDEIGILGARFNYMAEQVLALMHETIEKAAMEKELELASTVQNTIVPDGSVVELSGLKLAGYFKPAARCGGDWWSYYKLPPGQILVIIGDVTGHGLGPAMVTAAAKGAASTYVAAHKGALNVKDLLQAMNAAIHDTAKGMFVMTCFVSLFDPQTHKICYANAGHQFPYHYNAQKERLGALVARGTRLGDDTEADFDIREIDVHPDDTLIWYTDGFVECENAAGEEFGEKRFRQAICQHVGLPLDRVRGEIVFRANSFFGEVPQKDDITLVVGKFC